MFLSECLHKVRQSDILDVKFDYDRFNGPGASFQNLFTDFIIIHAPHDKCFRIFIKRRIHQQFGEVYYVSFLVGVIIMPLVCGVIYHKNRFRIIPIWRIVNIEMFC